MKLIFLILFMITCVYSKPYDWSKTPENKQLIMIKYNSLYENDLYILTVFRNDLKKFKTISVGWFNLTYMDNYIFEKENVEIHFLQNNEDFLFKACELDHDIFITKNFWKNCGD
jgi:hypothetical protein